MYFAKFNSIFAQLNVQKFYNVNAKYKHKAEYSKDLRCN